jgi:hypothetical protein
MSVGVCGGSDTGSGLPSQMLVAETGVSKSERMPELYGHGEEGNVAFMVCVMSI